MKAILGIIPFVFLLGCEFLQPQQVKTPDLELRLKADTLYDLKQYSQAEQIYGDLVLHYPWSADRNMNTYHWGRCRYEIAKQNQDSSSYAESIRRFAQVHSASLYKMYSLKYAGLAYHRMGDYEHAIQLYSECKKAFPGGDTLELNLYIYQARQKNQP